MYVYIKDEAVMIYNATREACDCKLPELSRDSNSGEYYISTFDDPFSPTFSMQLPPESMIDRFSVQGSGIYPGSVFRTEGYYELNGASLRCRNSLTGGKNSQRYQTVDVVAPTIKSLQEIYFLFRKGELLPKENWENPQATATTNLQTA